MFERCTEKARRSIFHARYEASKWGALEIETAHLLLAILREDKPLFEKVLGSTKAFDDAPERLCLKLPSETIPNSVDMPLSMEVKNVLQFAVEEAELLNHHEILPGHFLMGLLRQPGKVSDLLHESGLRLDNISLALQQTPPASVNQTTVTVKQASQNSKIIDQLREQFVSLTNSLGPAMEPAVVYNLTPGHRK